LKRQFNFKKICKKRQTSPIKTVERPIELGPVPSVEGNNFRRKILSSPNLTGANAMQQLESQAEKGKNKGKKPEL
jgi:hypothetical protein